MNHPNDDLEHVDQLLEEGAKRRELEKFVRSFQKQNQTNIVLGVMFLLMGAYFLYQLFATEFRVKIDGHQVMTFDGLFSLVMAAFMYWSGVRFIRPPAKERLLLILAEQALREKQEK